MVEREVGSCVVATVSSFAPGRAGAASGISETGAELGGALGIAILGSLGVGIEEGGAVGGRSPVAGAVACPGRAPSWPCAGRPARYGPRRQWEIVRGSPSVLALLEHHRAVELART